MSTIAFRARQCMKCGRVAVRPWDESLPWSVLHKTSPIVHRKVPS